MDQQSTDASPTWYRNAAILCVLVSGWLVWWAATTHDKVYWWLAGITIFITVRMTWKFIKARETRN